MLEGTPIWGSSTGWRCPLCCRGGAQHDSVKKQRRGSTAINSDISGRSFCDKSCFCGKEFNYEQPQLDKVGIYGGPVPNSKRSRDFNCVAAIVIAVSVCIVTSLVFLSTFISSFNPPGVSILTSIMYFIQFIPLTISIFLINETAGIQIYKKYDDFVDNFSRIYIKNCFASVVDAARKRGGNIAAILAERAWKEPEKFASFIRNNSVKSGGGKTLIKENARPNRPAARAAWRRLQKAIKERRPLWPCMPNLEKAMQAAESEVICFAKRNSQSELDKNTTKNVKTSSTANTELDRDPVASNAVAQGYAPYVPTKEQSLCINSINERLLMSFTKCLEGQDVCILLPRGSNIDSRLRWGLSNTLGCGEYIHMARVSTNEEESSLLLETIALSSVEDCKYPNRPPIVFLQPRLMRSEQIQAKVKLRRFSGCETKPDNFKPSVTGRIPLRPTAEISTSDTGATTVDTATSIPTGMNIYDKSFGNNEFRDDSNASTYLSDIDQSNVVEYADGVSGATTGRSLISGSSESVHTTDLDFRPIPLSSIGVPVVWSHLLAPWSSDVTQKLHVQKLPLLFSRLRCLRMPNGMTHPWGDRSYKQETAIPRNNGAELSVDSTRLPTARSSRHSSASEGSFLYRNPNTKRQSDDVKFGNKNITSRRGSVKHMTSGIDGINDDYDEIQVVGLGYSVMQPGCTLGITRKWASLIHTPPLISAATAERPLPDGFQSELNRRVLLPLTAGLFEKTAAEVSCTVLSSQIAVEFGLSICIGGGLHHAERNFGGQFCLLNDVAIASALALKQKRARRILIIDLDVHQGDGTARIFERIPEVFTLSVHCNRNAPFDKARSDLDVGLDPGCEDYEYLNAVDEAIRVALAKHQPDLIFYVAGVDVHCEDRIGRLNISDEGLRRREELVLERVMRYNMDLKSEMLMQGTCDEVHGNSDMPRSTAALCCVLGGGYAWRVNDTVNRHLELFACAHEYWHYRGLRKAYKPPPAEPYSALNIEALNIGNVVNSTANE